MQKSWKDYCSLSSITKATSNSLSNSKKIAVSKEPKKHPTPNFINTPSPGELLPTGLGNWLAYCHM